MKAYTTMLLILSIDIKALTIQKQKQKNGKDVLQKFPKINRKTPAPESLFLRKWQIEVRNIIKKRGFGIGVLCEFCEIFKNIFLTELLWAKRLDLPSLAYRSAQSNATELQKHFHSLNTVILSKKKFMSDNLTKARLSVETKYSKRRCKISTNGFLKLPGDFTFVKI